MSETPHLAALRREFDRVGEDGRTVKFWWRDDDAVAATPALDRLLSVADGAGIPLAVAAVPAAVHPSLPARLAGHATVDVIAHGWAHRDHETATGSKAAEFGAARSLEACLADAREGLERTQASFGDQALATFCPPWNRFRPDLEAALPSVGFRALSAFGQTGSAFGGGLRRIDTHLDPVAWRSDRSLVSPERLAAAFRLAVGNGTECHPVVGLLTHHLVTDETVWRFVEGLAALVARHPAAVPTSLRSLTRGLVGNISHVHDSISVGVTLSAASCR